MAQVVIRHSEDGLVIGHVTDDTGHIHKSGQFTCPLAAVARDDLIPAVLSGTHQCGLVYTACSDRLHKALHLGIVTDTKGMIFERAQLGQIEVDNFLFFCAGSVTGRGGLFRRGRGGSLLQIGRGIFRGGLTLGHFVSRGRLGLVGGRLVSLCRAALAGLGRCFVLRLRGFLFGSFLFRGLVLFGLLTGGGKIHHLARGSRGGIALVRGIRLLDLLVGLGRLGSRRAGSLRGGRLGLFRGSRLFSRGGIGHNRLDLFGSRLFRRGGRFSLFYLGADILFIVCQCQTSFVLK